MKTYVYEEKDKNKEDDKLLSTTEFGKLKGVTGQAIRYQIYDGKIKAIKIGANYFIHPDELKNYDPILEPGDRFKSNSTTIKPNNGQDLAKEIK